jgi:hypothetical protein
MFPKSSFQVRELKRRGYDDTKIELYVSRYNYLANLELLTDSENLSKNAAPFEEWMGTRDLGFRKRHLIPDMASLGFDSFVQFYDARRELIAAALRKL